jgi:hypothetical protein
MRNKLIHGQVLLVTWEHSKALMVKGRNTIIEPETMAKE